MSYVVADISKKEGYIAVRFQYDPQLVQKIKSSFKYRTWNPAERAWLIPMSITALDELKQMFKRLGYDMTISDALNVRLTVNNHYAKVSSDIKEGKVELSGFERFMHTSPMEHQKKALALLSKNNSFALFMEQGTGKTKIVLDFLRYLKENTQLRHPALIICPNSVVDNWVDEAEKHQPSLKVLALRGTVAEKAQLIANSASSYDAMVINYESTWRDKIAAELSRRRFPLLVLDESTRIMHHTSKQAKQCLKLGKQAERKVILTGTPAPNGPLNLYNQLRFINENLVSSSYYAFRDRYAVLGGWQNKQVVAYKNQDELIKIIDSISYKVKKEDCLDLPPKIYEVEKVELTGKQKNIYEQLKNEMIAIIDKEKIISATNALSRLVRLRQITSGFAAVDEGLYFFKDSPKLKWLQEYLHYSKNQLIVWCTFVNELELIQEILQENSISFVRYDGSISVEDRDKNIKKFQAGKARVFLATIKAAGLGLTLTAADTAIYMSNEFSGELRMQSEDRCHRIGQNKKVVYIDLVAKNTIDVSVRRLLMKKKEINNKLTSAEFKAIVEGELDI